MKTVISSTQLHFHDLVGHFLAMGCNDRFLRFGGVMTDAWIVAYVESLFASAESVLVAVEPGDCSCGDPVELIYELGVQKISHVMREYDDIAQYKAQFTGADLRRFTFNEVSRNGDLRYITAEAGQLTDMTHRLADFYGFKTGELSTDDQRNVTVMRIEGADELDWLLTLGAVVRTEDGESLRKGGAQR